MEYPKGKIDIKIFQRKEPINNELDYHLICMSDM